MNHSSRTRHLALILVMVGLMQISQLQSVQTNDHLQANIFDSLHNLIFGSSSSVSSAKTVTTHKAASSSVVSVAESSAVSYAPSFTVPTQSWFTVQGYRFPRTIRTGMLGDDVLNLQLILNRNPQTQMAKTGVESPGQETGTFDYKTRIGIIAFQKLNLITAEQLTRLRREQGFAGLTTRVALEKLAKDLVAQGQLPSDTKNLHAAAQSAASSLRLLQSSSSQRSIPSTTNESSVSSVVVAQASSIASTVTSTATSVTSQASSVSSTVSSQTSTVSSAASSVSSAVSGHDFYMDPVHGSKTGDGSQAKPWASFTDLINGKLISGADPTKGAIHAGDTIYLMTGTYGTVALSGDNTDYITIQGAPGQQPVINLLKMNSGSKWIFKGLTFRNATVGTNLIRIAANDIIITDNTLYSEDDVSAWTPADWDAKASVGIMFGGTKVLISHNTIKNVLRGILVSGDQIEVSSNTITNFADDGIDFGGSNINIHHNTITNHYGLLQDGNHNDGIQGYVLDGIPRYNLTIDSNIVMEYTGAAPASSITGFQGISIFDGEWINVTVTNNVSAVPNANGIALYGLKNAFVANNTVVRQSAKNPDPTQISWLQIHENKDGTQPENIIVRNNIANTLALSAVGVTQDHNISLNKKSPNWGNLGDLTVVLDPSTVFVNANQNAYDLHLKDGSPAIGAGNSIGAPTTDVTGKARSTMDIGAYAK